MNRYLILIFLTYIALSLFGNNAETIDTSDPFLDQNCPLFGAKPLWLLRQKLTLDYSETVLESTFITNNGDNPDINNFRMETYFPYFSIGNLKLMFGLRYFYSKLLIDEKYNYEKDLEHIFMWTVMKVDITNRVEFYLTLDSLFQGDSNNKFDTLGNHYYSFGSFVINIFEHSRIMLAGGVDYKQMYNEYTLKPIAGVQYIWQPTENFKSIIGLPVLTCFEWSPLYWLQIAGEIDYTFTHGAFIRWRLNNKNSLSIVYSAKDNKSEVSYFENTNSLNLDSLDQSFDFNSLHQLQYNIGLEYGVNIFEETAIIFKLGYLFSSDIDVLYNGNSVSNIEGRNGFSFGIIFHKSNF